VQLALAVPPEVLTVQTGVPPCLKCGLAADAVPVPTTNAVAVAIRQIINRFMPCLRIVEEQLVLAGRRRGGYRIR
jgi:hypothetical protein